MVSEYRDIRVRENGQHMEKVLKDKSYEGYLAA